ncbi:hypothetical protein KPL74_08895 [Bacillus sp. NP157]|nr:hypothetical protein KPL74_08895 [Bacillus sp. NP157]
MSGRQQAPLGATETLFHACAALDHAAMAQALESGADVHGVDGNDDHPLGAFIQAWQKSDLPPDPTPFVELLSRHGADLSRPGTGEWAGHTIGRLLCIDREAVLLDALIAEGMDWDDDIDDGELITRVVRNRAPNLLASLLQSPLDLDPDATDEDNMTALHALVDARRPDHETPDDTMDAMMTVLVEVCATGDVPDIYGQTAVELFQREAPELFDAWQTLVQARHTRLDAFVLDAALPDAHDGSEKGIPRL